MTNDTHQNLTLHRFLDTNGDGTGATNINGDYSATEEIFYIQPPAGKKYRISRMLLLLEDSHIVWDQYGGMGEALTNGIIIRTRNDSEVITDLTNGRPIKRNMDWGAHCYDVDRNSTGQGNDYFHGRWTFALAGQVLRLDGDMNERLECVVNDDLSGLVSHLLKVDGEIENTET